MTEKNLPCSEATIREIANRWPTPFHLYDERAIRAAARRLRDAFAWNKGFRNFFAVKAAPNPYLMRILQEEAPTARPCPNCSSPNASVCPATPSCSPPTTPPPRSS